METSFDPGSTEQMSTDEPTMDYENTTVSEIDNSTYIYSSDLSSIDNTASLISDTDTSSLSTDSVETTSIFIDTEPPTSPVDESSNNTDGTTLASASEMTESNTITTNDEFTTTIEENNSSDSSPTSFNTAEIMSTSTDAIFPDSSVTHTEISTTSIVSTSYPIVSFIFKTK